MSPLSFLLLKELLFFCIVFYFLTYYTCCYNTFPPSLKLKVLVNSSCKKLHCVFDSWFYQVSVFMYLFCILYILRVSVVWFVFLAMVPRLTFGFKSCKYSQYLLVSKVYQPVYFCVKEPDFHRITMIKYVEPVQVSFCSFLKLGKVYIF
jgi:hypothetical protein